MKRDSMATLIEFARQHSECSALDDALDAMDTAMDALRQTLPLDSRIAIGDAGLAALDRLRGSLLTYGDEGGVRLLDRIRNEEMAK